MEDMEDAEGLEDNVKSNDGNKDKQPQQKGRGRKNAALLSSSLLVLCDDKMEDGGKTTTKRKQTATRATTIDNTASCLHI